MISAHRDCQISLEQKKPLKQRKMFSKPDKRRLKRACLENPFTSLSKLKIDLNLAASSRTVRRELVSQHLNARKPAKKPFLSKKNSFARLGFERNHLN